MLCEYIQIIYYAFDLRYLSYLVGRAARFWSPSSNSCSSQGWNCGSYSVKGNHYLRPPNLLSRFNLVSRGLISLMHAPASSRHSRWVEAQESDFLDHVRGRRKFSSRQSCHLNLQYTNQLLREYRTSNHGQAAWERPRSQLSCCHRRTSSKMVSTPGALRNTSCHARH